MDAEIGIIGGSGFYSLMENAESFEIETKYGKTSDRISIGEIEGRRVAFMPRHGSKHNIPPHLVPYRANIDAFSQIGVKRIIATNATGSLNPEFKIGNIVAFDQFVNMTHGRKDTFFEDKVVHISTSDPYCAEMRKTVSDAAKNMGKDYKNNGSVLVINGPRFSTRAESLFFSRQGFDMINMTQYPEVVLAREKCICYLAIGIVTDYDVGLIGRSDIKPVSHKEVLSIFSQNIEKVKSIIKDSVANMPADRSCNCKNSLEGAIISE